MRCFIRSHRECVSDTEGQTYVRTLDALISPRGLVPTVSIREAAAASALACRLCVMLSCLRVSVIEGSTHPASVHASLAGDIHFGMLKPCSEPARRILLGRLGRLTHSELREQARGEGQS